MLAAVNPDAEVGPVGSCLFACLLAAVAFGSGVTGVHPRWRVNARWQGGIPRSSFGSLAFAGGLVIMGAAIVVRSALRQHGPFAGVPRWLFCAGAAMGVLGPGGDLIRHFMKRVKPAPADVPNRKPVIIDLLKLLASEELQLAYEKNVPHVDITAELLFMWFNDQYHPGEAFFASCFTADELAALERFNRFYEERVDKLPESQGTVRTWLTNPVWREIMREAQKTIECISV